MIKVTAVFEYHAGCEAAPVCSTLYCFHGDLAIMIRLNEHPPTFTRQMHGGSTCRKPTQSLKGSLRVIYKKWQWFVSKTKDWLCGFGHCSLFTHRWLSNWTRFRGEEEAHHQYKNIVQQFSCHSKHSYLSVNGPVTSAAIQITNKKHNPLHLANIRRGVDLGSGLQILAQQILFTSHHNWRQTGSGPSNHSFQYNMKTTERCLRCVIHRSISHNRRRPKGSRCFTINYYIPIRHEIWQNASSDAFKASATHLKSCIMGNVGGSLWQKKKNARNRVIMILLWYL